MLRILHRAVPALMILSLSTESAVAQSAPEQKAGAFRPGDRIYLRVEGEQQLTDTFTVRAGPLIELPALGSISLAGVRRAELTPYLTRAIGRFVNQPVVSARALVRIGMIGEVARPGFHDLPTDALLSDAVNAAGGPTKDAGMTKLRLERNGTPIVRDADLRRALDEGRTLDQLELQSGDVIVVPVRADTERTLRIAALLASIPATILAVALLRR
jgi:polysaccharide export outer membrane protein